MEVIPLITRARNIAGNPGDAYICLGLQHLLSKVVKYPQFLLLDKFGPEDFQVYESSIKQAGYVIYAGTPQYNNLDDWSFFYDWAMFKTYIEPYRVKFHTIAGGSGYPGTQMTPKEFSQHCLSSQRTKKALEFKKQLIGLATVRDLHAYELLKDIKQETHLLPCTALWSPKWLNIQPSKSKTVGLVPPSPRHVLPSSVGVHTHDEVTKWFGNYFIQLAQLLKQNGYSSVLVCHGMAEYIFYKQLNMDVFYSNDLVSLMKVYGELDGVISTRLHGAIPVAGMNKRSVLLGIDTRHSAADVIGIPKVLLGLEDHSPEQVLYQYLNSPVDYTDVIASSEERYLELFNETLSRS